MAKKKTKKKVTQTTCTDPDPDPWDEIGTQVSEFVDRVLELRSLAPVLAKAKSTVDETESRIRILRSEISNLMDGMLIDLPPEEPSVNTSDQPDPIGRPDFDYMDPPDPETVPLSPFDDASPAEDYDKPLRNTNLGTKAIASCNSQGLMTVGKIVEWWASGVPFSAIPGIGPAEDREIRRLIAPFRPKLPKIRAMLGM